jgi:hypothetical protein
LAGGAPLTPFKLFSHKKLAESYTKTGNPLSEDFLEF